MISEENLTIDNILSIFVTERNDCHELKVHLLSLKDFSELLR